MPPLPRDRRASRPSQDRRGLGTAGRRHRPGWPHGRLGSSAGADANDPTWIAGHDGRAAINVRALKRGRLTVRIRNEKTGCPAQTFRAG